MKLTKKTLILAAGILAGAAYLSGRESAHSPRYDPTSGALNHVGRQADAGRSATSYEFDAESAAAQWQAMAQQAQAQAWLQAAYGQQGYAGGSPADPYMGGDFYGNSLLGTAVSSSGDSGYIALGGGDFVSW